MKLKLMTPKKQILERDVISITLPGTDGQLTVLDGHDRLISGLKAGMMYFRYADVEDKMQREDYIVSEGGVEVLRDVTRVFAATAEKVNVQ